MAILAPHNPQIWSTQTTATNPSTTTIIAEVESSVMLSSRGGNVNCYAYLGASTAASWWIEQCLSTGLGSTAIRKQVIVATATGQTSQFLFKFTLEDNDRIRVRLGSTFTGTADASLAVERLA